jgi:uncharacterized protein YlxP (DUF503 family)
MALCYIEIKVEIPFSTNLKQKRGILSALTTRLKKKFNVSIAEIDLHDVWKSSKLGIAIVAKDRFIFDPMIDSIMTFIEDDFPDLYVSIVNREIL